jgi:hypothetical protein
LTEALTALEAVEPVEHAAMKASRLSAPAPTTKAEPFKKLRRLSEDPRFSSVPMRDLLQNGSVRPTTKHDSRGNVYSVSLLRGVNLARAKPGVKRNFPRFVTR